MQRALNLSELWNWLPAFRAVGEYQSIQRAAQAIHVSPSALSRTIRLLEDAVGTPLFGRTSTGLVLTEFGKELLAITRETMRRVDDVLASRHSHALTPRSVAASAVSPLLLSLLGIATARLYTSPTTPRARLGLVDSERIAEELLTGTIDYALVEVDLVPKLPEELVLSELGTLEFALHAPSSMAQGGGRPAGVVVIGDAVVEGYDVVASAPTVEAVEALALAAGALAFLPRPLAPRSLEVVAGGTASVPIARVVRRPLAAGSLPWIDQLSNAISDVIAR